MSIVDLEAARRSLAAQVPRTAALLRAIPDPDVPIAGSEWTVGEAAAHLAIGAEGYSEYARGLERTHPIDLADVAGSTAQAFAAMPERDGAKLAGMVESGTALFLDATAGMGAGDPVAWHSGLRLPCATITCFALAEQFLHGWDIAQTLGVDWEIPAGDARLILDAIAPLFALTVDPEAAVGLDAEYELAIGDGTPWYATFRNGALTMGVEPSGEPACRLAGDPVTWLLGLYGRVRWDELLGTCRISVAGSIELAQRFKSLLRNP